MRRHSIIARLGPADKIPVAPHEKDSVVTAIPFIDGDRRLNHGLGVLIDRLGKRGLYPDETAIDLLIVAAVVTAADTRISRQTESQDGWTREIDLYIPVEKPAVWLAQSPLLERTLRFLTGDHWRLFFRSRHESTAELIKRPAGLAVARSIASASSPADSTVLSVPSTSSRPKRQNRSL